MIWMHSFVIYLLFMTEQNAGNTCPPNYQKYGTNVKCYREITEKLPRSDGACRCRQDSGQLLSIHAGEDTDFLFSSRPRLPDDHWIGLNDLDNGLSWTDGSDVTWTNWEDGEPNKSKHKCVVTNGKWFDRDCDDLNMVLCQWTNESESVMPCPMSSSEGTTKMIAETTPQIPEISTHALSSEPATITTQTSPVDNNLSITSLITDPLASITGAPTYHISFDTTTVASQEKSQCSCAPPAEETVVGVQLATSTTDGTSTSRDKLSTGSTVFNSVSEAGHVYNASVTSFVQCIVSLIEANDWNGPCASHFAIVDGSSTTRESEPITVTSDVTPADVGYTVKSGMFSEHSSMLTKLVTEKATSATTTQAERLVTRVRVTSSSEADQSLYIGIIKFVPKSHEATGASVTGTLLLGIVSVVVGCIVYSDLHTLRNHFRMMRVNLGISFPTVDPVP